NGRTKASDRLALRAGVIPKGAEGDLRDLERRTTLALGEPQPVNVHRDDRRWQGRGGLGKRKRETIGHFRTLSDIGLRVDRGLAATRRNYSLVKEHSAH